jgi:predicted transcriptional regulator
VSAAPDWNDVARFVSEYMAGKHQGVGTGNLLNDIASAYIQARGLPSSDLPSVIQIVDSVL